MKTNKRNTVPLIENVQLSPVTTNNQKRSIPLLENANMSATPKKFKDSKTYELFNRPEKKEDYN